jgi:hypothetical protein
VSARTLILAGVAVLVAAAPAGAAGPRVRAMVVDRSGDVIAGVRSVRLDAFTFDRCRIREGLPLAALRELRVGFRARGDCASLYVFQVGSERARRQQGWVYKVGTRNGSAGAADPSGPFGNGPIRSGAEVVWFWCRRATNCQRTLTITGERHVARGGRMRLRVRGYDDFGRSRVIRGARVSFGSRSVRTNRRGLVDVRMSRSGLYRVRASKDGLVPAFPIGVRVR